MASKPLSWIIALSIVWAPFGCLAAADAPTGPEAVLYESIFEFKPLVEGTPVEHDFIILNRGDKPLKIVKIRSG